MFYLQETRGAEGFPTKFTHPDRTCWLDSAYSRLAPEWQEIIYKVSYVIFFEQFQMF